jgi:hypothetical protein
LEQAAQPKVAPTGAQNQNPDFIDFGKSERTIIEDETAPSKNSNTQFENILKEAEKPKPTPATIPKIGQ